MNICFQNSNVTNEKNDGYGFGDGDGDDDDNNISESRTKMKIKITTNQQGKSRTKYEAYEGSRLYNVPVCPKIFAMMSWHHKIINGMNLEHLCLAQIATNKNVCPRTHFTYRHSNFCLLDQNESEVLSKTKKKTILAHDLSQHHILSGNSRAQLSQKENHQRDMRCHYILTCFGLRLLVHCSPFISIK